jgi:hypothetical protein
MEEFIYYDIPMRHKVATIALANKIAGRSGIVETIQ